MRIINWNINCMSSRIEEKINYLLNYIKDDSFIIILEEVKEHYFNIIQESFSDIANIEYSLKYRVPGKYDDGTRKLGITIIASKDITILSADVLHRSLFPDRTLLINLMYNNQEIKVLGFHSITGCDFHRAKEVQYYSLAEAIDEFKPDIVGFDANEPEIDHYNVHQMIFYDNKCKGNGCKTFFETMIENNLIDAFIKDYNINNYIDGECLAHSHIIKNSKRRVRYDFLYINKNLFSNYECDYDYDGAISAGSDHAAIILNAR